MSNLHFVDIFIKETNLLAIAESIKTVNLAGYDFVEFINNKNTISPVLKMNYSLQKIPDPNWWK